MYQAEVLILPDVTDSNEEIPIDSHSSHSHLFLLSHKELLQSEYTYHSFLRQLRHNHTLTLDTSKELLELIDLRKSLQRLKHFNILSRQECITLEHITTSCMQLVIKIQAKIDVRQIFKQ